LCYEACRSGLKYDVRYDQNLVGLNQINGSLGTLLNTYKGQWKTTTDQQRNVTKAIDVCTKFTNILQQAPRDGNRASVAFRNSYRDANKLFAKETSYKSTAAYRDVVIFAQHSAKIQRELNRAAYVEEYIGDSNVILHRLFYNHVEVISKEIYRKMYAHSEASQNHDAVVYKRALGDIVRQQIDHNYCNPYYQNVEDPRGPEMAPDELNLHAKGAFLYWRAIGRRTKIVACRLYLNVKNNFDSHQRVIRELIRIISSDDYLTHVSDFKITHLATNRKDTVCIYCDSLDTATKLAKEINQQPLITTHLNHEVANMQRMRFPGIGIGVEPERRLKYGETGNDQPQEKSQWSYGTHRSFLVAWGLARARKYGGVVIGSATYVEDCLFHIEALFEHEGISLQKGHKLMR
jgi:hypothetical protein